MNDGMKKIPLLRCLNARKEFIRPASRLIEAQYKQYRFYHERPIQRDMFAEYDAIAAWSTVTCCYSGIEQSMKCLLEMRGIIDRKTHWLGKLFRKLAPEEQHDLRFSYAIYRSLHDYILPETVEIFLDKIDQGYSQSEKPVPGYNTWRYFLLEGKMPPTTHPGAMLEIWSALTDILLARVFTNHSLNSVNRRISHFLYEKFIQVWDVHINTDIGQREIDDMNRWRQSHKNIVINAYIDLFFRHAEGRLDLIEVLPSTREVLNTMVEISKETFVDNDISHFLDRAQIGEIVWNPDENFFEKISRSEEIKIKFIESECSYVEDLLGHSVKAEFIESVPDYIEDFILEPRVEGKFVDDDWSVEDEVWKARIEYYEERKAETREYEGGNWVRRV